MPQGHINALSTFKTYKPFGDTTNLIKAKVVSNEDTRLLGRIKVSIPDLIPWDDKEKLPWIYPLYPAGLGEGPLSTNFAVPEEDSQVIVFSGNPPSIYNMFYAFSTIDRLNRPVSFTSEYPQRYGWSDSLENKKIVNKNKEINTIEHRFADGTLSIHDSKDATNLYIDFYGTHVYIDRKKQKLMIQFADQEVDITRLGVFIKAKKVVLTGEEGVVINSKEGISLNAPYVVSGGRIIGKIVDNTDSEQ